MNRDLERLETLLGDLLELEPAQRRQRLAALHAAADPCAAAVERLLAMHERGDPALATPPERGLLPAGFDPLCDALVDPLLGRELGDFTLVRLVGTGGMGRVYEGRQRSPARRVAVKVLAAHALAGAASRQRFQREADLLGTLEHPGICRIYSAGTAIVGAECVPYIAMEFVDGVTLDRAAKGLDLPAQLALVAAVADAMQYAHGRGVVHRDLKPANVLVGRDPDDPASPLRPRVLDFGVSRALAADGDAVRTESGLVAGTPGYMSPEQLAGRPPDARADVYALGVMLFELLAGRRPFVGGRTGTEHEVRTREAPRLGTFVRPVSRDLEAVLARALEREPPRRYRTAAEFATELRAVRLGQPVQARRLTWGFRVLRWVRDRRRAVAAAAAATAVLVGSSWAAFHYANEAATSAVAKRWTTYVGQLQFAEAALRAYDIAGTRAHLAAVEPARRGWEWRELAAAAATVERILATAGQEPPHAWIPVAETRDIGGTALFAPFHDMVGPERSATTLELLDPGDSRVLARVAELDSRPTRAARSRDGRFVVMAWEGRNAVLQVHAGATGERLARRAGLDAEQVRMVLAPGGDSVAVGASTGVVRTFALPDLTPLAEWTLPGAVDGIAYAPGGDRIAVAHAPNGLGVFAVASGRRLAACETRGGMPIYPTFSDDGARLASLNHRETNLNLWDAATGRLLRRQPIPEHPMSLVGIPGNDRLAVGACDGGVRIFDFGVTEHGSWAPLLTLRETDKVVHNLLASWDGTALVVGLEDGSARVWRVPPADAAEALLPNRATIAPR